jgi:hypothetical protein
VDCAYGAFSSLRLAAVEELGYCANATLAAPFQTPQKKRVNGHGSGGPCFTRPLTVARGMMTAGAASLPSASSTPFKTYCFGEDGPVSGHDKNRADHNVDAMRMHLPMISP